MNEYKIKTGLFLSYTEIIVPLFLAFILFIFAMFVATQNHKIDKENRVLEKQLVEKEAQIQQLEKYLKRYINF